MSARGWCNAHYKRWRRLGDPLAGGPPQPKGRSGCYVVGCSGEHHALGVCLQHYRRLHRTGTTGEPYPQTPEERFWLRVEPTGFCWYWIGGKTKGSSGYGSFYWGGKHTVAHRWAYEFLVGPIAEGLELDHLCRNHPCVNPDHLEPVTRAENVRRGRGPDVTRELRRQVTCCPQGHPYAGDNLYTDMKGARHCRLCRAEQARLRYHKQRGDAPLMLPPGERMHCPQGHAYDEVNTYIDKKGQRSCRQCSRDRSRKYQRQRRELHNPGA